jgi:hypothetical protein
MRQIGDTTDKGLGFPFREGERPPGSAVGCGAGAGPTPVLGDGRRCAPPLQGGDSQRSVCTKNWRADLGC